MDFALSEEQQAIFDMARDFGAEHIAPYSEEWELEGTIPRALWTKAAELGLGGAVMARGSAAGSGRQSRASERRIDTT